MVTQQFEQRTRELIDSLKTICAAYGLGNDGNEFKIITQVFLYKFLNDKFAFEAKKIRPELAKTDSWEAAISAMSADDLEMLQMQTGPDTARLKPERQRLSRAHQHPHRRRRSGQPWQRHARPQARAPVGCGQPVAECRRPASRDPRAATGRSRRRLLQPVLAPDQRRRSADAPRCHRTEQRR